MIAHRPPPSAGSPTLLPVPTQLAVRTKRLLLTGDEAGVSLVLFWKNLKKHFHFLLCTNGGEVGACGSNLTTQAETSNS